MVLGDVGGKVAVLRTFRVFRALKTVAVVPGNHVLTSTVVSIPPSDSTYSQTQS